MKPCIIFILMISLTVGHGSKLPSCVIVMPYIWLYGETAVTQWGKANGYTDEQIAVIKKRCEKGK